MRCYLEDQPPIRNTLGTESERPCARRCFDRGADRAAPGRAGARLAALLALSTLGCASIDIFTSGDEVEKLARANESAREQLAFGMSKEKATAILGEAEVHPPWANDLGIGPQVVRNPFDTLHFESPLGEEYEVLRYAVGLHGEPRCPFVHGDAVLVPLIFFEEKLVGWRWSYMEGVLQRRLREDERAWDFGRLCGPASEEPGARPLRPPGSATPGATHWK